MSFCVSRERTSGGQLNACPLDCKNELEAPTCGSDGSIYRNECEMQMLNCGSVTGDVRSFNIVGRLRMLRVHAISDSNLR